MPKWDFEINSTVKKQPTPAAFRFVKPLFDYESVKFRAVEVLMFGEILLYDLAAGGADEGHEMLFLGHGSVPYFAKDDAFLTSWR